MGSSASQPYHSGVIEAGQNLDLAPEPAHAQRIDHPQELDGDQATRRRVPGAEHLRHPAPSQQLFDLMALVDQHP
jgi:hypothetical protein